MGVGGKKQCSGPPAAARIAAVLFVALSLVAGWPTSSSGASSPLADPATYPRDPLSIKGLQPDYWPTKSDVAPQLATVSINFFWAEWQPIDKPAPCAGTEVEYDGKCFVIPIAPANEVAAYSAIGVPATAILYGTPPWARGEKVCSPVSPGFEVFCVPDHPEDYARFVGMIAERFNGANGFGRVTDFVIQNEVNSNNWYDIGCGQGTPCDLHDWIAHYAELYNQAYDEIVVAQPQARVLFSFTQHFGPIFDHPDATDPLLSMQTFMTHLVPLVGTRLWSVAYHPYPRNIFVPKLDARDYPVATLGNLGVVPGWLLATFPDHPRAGEVQLTEQGLNNDGTQDDLQRESLCTAFRNVLGTPGVTSFIYHRLVDHPDEMGLSLGLRHFDGTPKPAFALWRDASDPSAPSCGFELAGRTLVRHATGDADGAHRYSSRVMPAGYTSDEDPAHQWFFERAEEPGTTMVFECGGNRSTYLSTDAGCGTDRPFGPVGAIRATPGSGFTGLFVCRVGQERTVSTDPACASGDRQLLGYVAAGEPTPTTTSTTSTSTTVFSGSALPAAQAVAAMPTFTG